MLDKLKEDLKRYQLAKNELGVSVVRILLSEINYASINKNNPLNDADIVAVVQKEVKKRQESVEAFTKGGRADLAIKEEEEMKLLENYLPPQLNNEQLQEIVKRAINELGASSLTDMGKVISKVVSQVQGQASGGRVSQIVKEQLGEEK